METKTIVISKKNKLSVKIISFLDKANLLKDKKCFLDAVCSELKNLKEKENFGGFINERGFRFHLESILFSWQQNIERYPSQKIQLKIAVHDLKEIMQKIKNILQEKEITIYLFPTSSQFIIKKMGGTAGWLAWKDIMHVCIYPTKNWRLNFKGTILHELAHCMQKYYSYKMKLSDHLIADGLAEHFQEKLLDGKRNLWTKAVSKNQAKIIFRKIKPLLSKRNLSVHKELFFGSKKYPCWTGYTIGYYLIDDYLKKHKSIDWKTLFNQKPARFLRELRGWY
jgi:uncharacterized protein YjaZ